MIPHKENKKIGKTILKISGLSKTRPSVVDGCFKSLSSATDLTGLNRSLQEGVINLDQLDLFSDCNVSLEMNHKKDVIVFVDLKEKRKTFYKIGATVSTKGEHELGGSFGWRNLLGLADKTQIGVSAHGKNTFSITSSFDVPNAFFGRKFFVNSDLFTRKGVLNTGIIKKVTGLEMGSEIFDNFVVSTKIAKRRVSNFKEDPDIKNEFFNNLTYSSLSFVYVLNGKDRLMNPQNGYLAKFYSSFFYPIKNKSELSTPFVRNEISLAIYKKFSKYLSTALELSVGGISPFKNNCLIDLDERLVTSVRGYETDRNRGKYYFNALLRFSTPLTFLSTIYKQTNISFQSYVNAGNTYTHSSQLKKFYSDFLLSKGIGLCLFFNIGRIELNYNLPLVNENQVKVNKFEFKFVSDI